MNRAAHLGSGGDAFRVRRAISHNHAPQLQSILLTLSTQRFQKYTRTLRGSPLSTPPSGTA